MIAVIKTGGKQYSVKTGQILKVEKLEGKKGDNVSINDVLALSDSKQHTVGNPLIKGATVDAKIIDQIRDKKIIVFKKRKRQNYRSTQGHRQFLTILKIQSINHGSKKETVIETKTSKDKIQEKKKVSKKVAPVKKDTSSKNLKKKVVTKKSTKTKK